MLIKRTYGSKRPRYRLQKFLEHSVHTKEISGNDKVRLLMSKQGSSSAGSGLIGGHSIPTSKSINSAEGQRKGVSSPPETDSSSRSRSKHDGGGDGGGSDDDDDNKDHTMKLPGDHSSGSNSSALKRRLEPPPVTSSRAVSLLEGNGVISTNTRNTEKKRTKKSKRNSSPQAEVLKSSKVLRRKSGRGSSGDGGTSGESEHLDRDDHDDYDCASHNEDTNVKTGTCSVSSSSASRRKGPSCPLAARDPNTDISFAILNDSCGFDHDNHGLFDHEISNDSDSDSDFEVIHTKPSKEKKDEALPAAPSKEEKVSAVKKDDKPRTPQQQTTKTTEKKESVSKVNRISKASTLNGSKKKSVAKFTPVKSVSNRFKNSDGSIPSSLAHIKSPKPSVKTGSAKTSSTRKTQKKSGRPSYPPLPLVCSLQRCALPRAHSKSNTAKN